MWHPNISWENMSQMSVGIRSRLTFSQITRACALRRSRVLVHPQTFGKKKENQHSQCHIYVYVKCDFVVVVHDHETVCFPEDDALGTDVTATSVKLGWVAVTLCHPQHYSGMFKICGSFPACPHAACVAGTASDVTDHWPDRDTRFSNMFLSFPCVTKVTSKVKCDHLTFDCWSALIALHQACPNYGPGAICGPLEVFSSGPPET